MFYMTYKSHLKVSARFSNIKNNHWHANTIYLKRSNMLNRVRSSPYKVPLSRREQFVIFAELCGGVKSN